MRLNSEKRGFTLIEIMVSILLLAITLTGGMVLYHNAEQIMALMVHKKVAMELADEKMEEIRNKPFVSLPNNDVPVVESNLKITGLPASRKTVISQPASNLKEVRVEVNWNEAGAVTAKSVELVSYVAK